MTALERRSIYECCILMCDMQYGPSEEDKSGPTEECDHDRNACDDCLKRTFEDAINSSDLETLACPEPECLKLIRGERVRNAVSDVTYRKYVKVYTHCLLLAVCR
jgi:hypothetical protein